MKITTTITELTISHEVIKPEDRENEVLITRVESIGPVIISENGARIDLVECLQKGAHNYISTKLKGE